jgi:chromosome segregation protein
LRLKKIEIFGFKSFADRTVIEFDVGITGVVGPNGCGKSNVADAFRWVMGEQSARSLRGEKMGDVIFAGTSKRKACQYAEVVLTFTDVGGALPVEYEEVAVGRRLYRNGDSEYVLNGNAVRLKDIHSLFWDTGLGKDSLAIFEQGKIEEVILRTPQERRPIFESASGVLRFRERRKEALRKLEQTGHNLSRIEDVLSEVSRQMEQLEKQVAEAKEYREGKERLESLERAILRTKLVRMDEAIAKGEEQLSKLDERLKQGEERVEAGRTLFSQLEQEMQEREKGLQAAREAFYQARSQRDMKQVESDGIKKRVGELDRMLKKYETELKALDSQAAELRQEEAVTVQGVDELPLLSEAESRYKEGRVAADSLETEVGEWRAQQKVVDRDRMQLVQTSHAVSSQLRETKVRLESGRERLEKINGRIAQLQQRKGELEAAVEERKRSVNHFSESVDLLKGKLRGVEERLKESSEAVQSSQQRLEVLRAERTEKMARQRVLQRLREEMETVTPGTRQLLEAEKGELSGKLSPLYEGLRPKTGMAQALASVLAPYAQTLLARSLSVMREVCEYAQKNGIVGFSITAPELLEEAQGLSLLQGDCSWFTEVKQIAAIDFARPERNQVTPEGLFVDGCGVLFCPAAGESNAFLREAELEELQDWLTKNELNCKGEEEALATCRQLVTQLQADRSESDKAHRQEEMKLIEANFGLQRALRDVETHEQESKQIAVEEEQLKKVDSDLEQAVAKLEMRWSEVHHEVEAIQRQFHEIEVKLEEGLAKFNACRKSLQEREELFQELNRRVQQRQAAHRLLEAKLQAIERQRQRISGEAADGEGAKKELLDQMEELQQQLTQAAAMMAERESNCRSVEAEVAKAKEGISGGDKKLSEARAALQELAASRQKIEFQQGQQLEGRRLLFDEIEQRFGLTIDQLKGLELPAIGSVRDGEVEIHRLRRKLEEATNVNLAAIEEYEEHQKRSAFLATQVGDLQGSKKELAQIIHQLEKLSRTQFKETFEKIRANFQRQFQALFQGGEADLRLTDSQDVLEAGIEIVARPPGKQMRSITLLSGGEKCMTAMALLFAIFEVNPSPVCILDETDAPLDETNVGRFVEVLRSFLDRTQFILITHNKKTMEAAGVLIGVTMEERGVSKPIEMRLESSKKLQEPVTAGSH